MFDVTPKTSPKTLDCGPTCLQMLLEYYGITVELETLIAECNVGLRGCTAGALRSVGNAHGLDLIIYDDRSSPHLVDNLLKQDRPAIVWWKYNHYCVYCGKDSKGDVVICNPDRGRYSISVGSFKSFYSGVNLTNGEPKALPEDDSDVVEVARGEYNDIMDVVNKAGEVFADEAQEENS